MLIDKFKSLFAKREEKTLTALEKYREHLRNESDELSDKDVELLVDELGFNADQVAEDEKLIKEIKLLENEASQQDERHKMVKDAGRALNDQITKRAETIKSLEREADELQTHRVIMAELFQTSSRAANRLESLKSSHPYLFG